MEQPRRLVKTYERKFHIYANLSKHKLSKTRIEATLATQFRLTVSPWTIKAGRSHGQQYWMKLIGSTFQTKRPRVCANNYEQHIKHCLNSTCCHPLKICNQVQRKEKHITSIRAAKLTPQATQENSICAISSSTYCSN